MKVFSFFILFLYAANNYNVLSSPAPSPVSSKCSQISDSNSVLGKAINIIPKLEYNKDGKYSTTPCLYTGKIEGIYYLLNLSNTISKKSEQLVVYMSGGPGSSFFFSFFLENGSLELKENGKVSIRDISWSNFANILYLDFPIGTGSSELKTESENSKVSEKYKEELTISLKPQEMSKKFNSFLTEFIKFFEKEFSIIVSDLSISGEGSAALIIPNLTLKFNEISNKKIKRLLLYSPIIDTYQQLLDRKSLIKGMGLMDSYTEDIYDTKLKQCELKSFKNPYALNCPEIEDLISTLTGDSCMFDIRQPEQYFKNLEIRLKDYLNDETVKKEFGFESFQAHNGLVKLIIDTNQHSSILDIIELIKKDEVRITFVSGQFGLYSTSNTVEDIVIDDLLNPLIENYKKEMIINKISKDKQQKTFERLLWKVKSDGKEFITIGYISQLQKLSLIVVRNAGHFIGLNKLHESILILKNTLSDIKYTCPTNNEECFLSNFKCTSLSNCWGNGECNGATCICKVGYTGPDCSFKIDILDVSSSFELQPGELKVFTFSDHLANSEKTLLILLSSEKEHSTTISLISKVNSSEVSYLNSHDAKYSLFHKTVEFFVDTIQSKSHYLVIRNNDSSGKTKINMTIETTSKLFIFRYQLQQIMDSR